MMPDDLGHMLQYISSQTSLEERKTSQASLYPTYRTESDRESTSTVMLRPTLLEKRGTVNGSSINILRTFSERKLL